MHTQASTALIDCMCRLLHFAAQLKGDNVSATRTTHLLQQRYMLLRVCKLLVEGLQLLLLLLPLDSLLLQERLQFRRRLGSIHADSDTHTQLLVQQARLCRTSAGRPCNTTHATQPLHTAPTITHLADGSKR